MRFSTTALLALPLLASAAESPFEQYKAKFQNFLGSFGASTPGGAQPKAAEAPAAAAPHTPKAGGSKSKAAAEPKKIETLTLDNWRDTFYGPVTAQTTEPEEWLVLMSGGNKTCFGRCTQADAAFLESASKFSASSSPRLHLGYLNCDDQPVLCNSWGSTAGFLWLFEVLPPPAQVDLYTKRLNLTTVTAETIVDAYTRAERNGPDAQWFKFDSEGWFHPLSGKLARWGVAIPLAYVVWVLNVIPSWGMMLILSFVSRYWINRRVGGMNRPAAPAAAGAPRAAPAGDGRS